MFCSNGMLSPGPRVLSKNLENHLWLAVLSNFRMHTAMLQYDIVLMCEFSMSICSELCWRSWTV